MKFWDEKEKILLKELIKTKTLSQSSKILNRGESSVRSMVKKLHLRFNTYDNYNRFSEEDIEFIQINYNKLSVVKIAKHLNRSLGSVRNKFKDLGILGITELKKWKKEEIEYVKLNFNVLTHKEIAKNLNRPVRMIYAKVSELGISNFQNDLSSDIIVCPVCKNTFNNTKENFYYKKIDNTLSSSTCKKCAVIKTRKSTQSLPKYINHLLNGIKTDVRRRKKCNQEINITLEYLINLYNEQNGKCNITGIVLSFGNYGGKNLNNLSIDRIDSSKGYIIGNIQIVCTWANLAKTTLSMKELKDFIKLSYTNLF